ncbi:hypothetical protein [Acetivibrio mesophilus]|uniref:Alkaline ceramidase n=1 Tax=Acetivibrio mesophilus TaxID=2487273 RepID=A0A4Q0I1K7_9FIRM|nr:hypothetical protein [Acetivibrio mesophilus]ODM27105.1 hypothetical protein A7W90_13275 [Clostridium sp. Bc-iso-3]RXE58016.1 alkaline ceramidase [Acetivibrio mesophilus]HHV30655.1 alkaline ceramidase [Clostridium sp.]
MSELCQVAFSQVDITPDFQVELIGCYRKDNRSQGVLHPLYAQILLFQKSGETFCLVAIDSLGLTKALADDLRTRVANHLNTVISHVMLNFSHTHSAPAPSSFALNGELYFNYLCEQILKCVDDAKTNYSPCKAGWAVADTWIGENRREGCTVVDNRLGALKLVDSKSGRPIAVVLRITAHANILMSDNCRISSDYFSIAREKLRSYFSCPVILIQGAAGNVKPVGVHKIFGGKISDLERIADILVDSAKGLEFKLDNIEDIRMFSREINYISDVPSETEAQRIAQEALNTCGIDGANWLGECERLRKAGINTQTLQGELQFFKLNNGCFCGVPEEIFAEIAIEVQEKVNDPLVFFNGYTNGCTGYLPHMEEWEKGGFETLYSYLTYYPFHGHVMPFRKNTAEYLVKLVIDNWRDITAI